MLNRSRLVICFAVAFAVTAPVLAGQPMPGNGQLDLRKVQADGLTVDQAKQLLVMVLKHEKLFMNKPGFNIEHLREFVPGYANFFVTYDTPRAGATEVIGAFAISPRTGDVWETNLCKRYDFPALRRAQAEIMQRTGKTPSGEVSERRGLGCTDE